MTVSNPSKSHSSEGSRASVRRQPLLWLNVICLDAPLVAISWQLLFARVFHVTLRPAEYFALFLTAWWIYLLDRFADAIVLAPNAIRSARIDFCLRHRNRRAALLVIVGLLDGITIVKGLDRETIVCGLIFGALALVYLAINFACSKVWRTIPFKEIAIGFLFAIGVVMVPWLRARPAQPGLLASAILFGCLCSMNCLSIAVWERELDEKQGKHSFATSYPGAGSFVRVLCVIVAIGSLVLSFWVSGLWAVTACLALSSALLLGLHCASFARDERTALADLVLLTPLLFLIGERLM